MEKNKQENDIIYSKVKFGQETKTKELAVFKVKICKVFMYHGFELD